jgi:excisionase family DNA binding protein
MIRRWVSVDFVSKYCDLHPVTVRRLIDKGKIPASKIGRSVRVDLKKLNQQLAGDSEYE